jgi:hypothetical protein
MDASKRKRSKLSAARKRQLKRRKRLANATIRYFEQLDGTTMAQENSVAKDLMSCANTIDFDKDS